MGGNSSSHNCYLLKATPVGHVEPGFDSWPVQYQGFCIISFHLNQFSLLSVSSSNFLSITRLCSSFNNYCKNVVLESRVSVLVNPTLNLKVLGCIGCLTLKFLIWQQPLLVFVLFPAVVFENQQNVVDAFILDMCSHADFLFSHCQGQNGPVCCFVFL